MRIRKLDLVAFGPFSGEELDLSGGAPGGLQLLIGENEAGKSTALRAVSGLLFGIPERTTDAHVHPASELCIGACLEQSDGNVLDVVRRKKRKDSLRDSNDQPLDEAVLERLLSGVDEELFRTLFGLDHQRLKEGGEALIQGRGDVGESLFEAGIGGGGVHSLLVELRDKRDRLFRPRATTAELNAAVAAYADAKKRMRDAQLSPDAYDRQAAELEQSRRVKNAADERLRALRTEQQRLERLLRLLGPVARRRQRIEERAALGDVPVLPEGVRRRREAALRELADAERDRERLEREIAIRSERGAALDVVEPLLSISEELVQKLAADLAVMRKAAHDRPRIVSAIRAGEDDAHAILRRLGREVPLPEIDRLRVTTAAQKRLRELAGKQALIAERVERASEQCRRLEGELAARRAALERLGVAVAVDSLREVTSEGRHRGDLDERLQKARADAAELTRKIAKKALELRPWSVALEDLDRIDVPPIETIESEDRRVEKSAADRARKSDALSRLTEQLRGVESRLNALHRQGDIPTESELIEARARRDDTWRRVKSAWLEGSDAAASLEPARALPEAYEAALERSDDLADRLRREANRVSELATLEAQRDELGRTVVEARDEVAELDARAAERSGIWKSRWSRSTLSEPGSPAEMLGWRRRFDALVELDHARRDAEAERACLELEQSDLVARLARALRASGGAPLDSTSFATALAVAEARLAELVETERARRALRDEIARSEAELEHARNQLRDRVTALSDWGRKWSEAVVPLGLSGEPSPDEAIATLDETLALFTKLDELSEKRRRVDGIDRDAQIFKSEIERLVAAHRPGLAGKSAEDAADALIRSVDQARRDARERTRLDGEVAERQSALERAGAAAKAAERELSELMRAARVSNVGELERAEACAERARELDRELREIDNELLEVGGGLSLDALLVEASGVERAGVMPRKVEIEQEIEEQQAALEAAIGNVKSIESGLERLDAAGEQASEAAQETALLGAEVRDGVERYARLKLAVTLLEREIERYRERNQGPVLARASELFPRLTLGRYKALRAGLEENVLRCVRADGRELDLSELSEGAQYQLFLALRLATLERYLEANDPMPLVLDDVLIHFDDARARAAFEVLGELAARMQILYFTHLERDGALAREAVPKGRLFEHRLASPAFVEVRAGSRTRARHA